jgi:site-specific DNA-methyltransferase (adenine-specific)
MSELYDKTYNPDVLSCLANLSNDEVFTPPEVANEMLDMLPAEIWSDPDATFLDPACKSGVFLREIARRLIKGLEGEFPDLGERLEHIFKKQLHGVAITELTSLLSRRSVYCSKYPNSRYSVVEFDSADGNVRFKRCEHEWSGGRCRYCGASQSEYDRGEDLETHAYEFIHTEDPKELLPMKFDVIIGNPPYQLSDGGNGASAMPIYHKFVCQAKKLNPRYLTMIIPARWFVGGRGLDSFRSEMLHDDRVRVLHDFPNASDCFPGVEIKGGVCYFLWDRDNRGLCSVYSHDGDAVAFDERPLLEEGMDTFIRNSTQISVLEKVRAYGEKPLSGELNAGRYFGFHTRVIWNGDDGTLQTADGSSSYPVKNKATNEFSTKVYVAHGECWIRSVDVARNSDDVARYKVLIPRAGNPGGSILGTPKLSEPGTCSSNTYNVIILGDSEDEANNLISYLKTRFVRYLVATRTSTQDMAPKAFEFVPVQDWSKPWSDEVLFEKYGLSEAEIEAILNAIPEMS